MIPNFFAFGDELEKIAAGPKIIEDRGSRISRAILGTPAAAGFYAPPQEIATSKVPAIQGLAGAMGKKHGVVVTPDQRLFERASEIAHKRFPRIAKAADKVGITAKNMGKYVRTHEMTHYMRERKGLLPTEMAKSPVQHVINTARVGREEVAANLRAAKVFKHPVARGLAYAATPMQSATSVAGYGWQGLSRPTQDKIIGTVSKGKRLLQRGAKLVKRVL